MPISTYLHSCMRNRFLTGVLVVGFCTATAGAQDDKKEDRKLIAGIQIRPLLASKFFGAGPVTDSDRHLETTIKPSLGYTFGMVIRRSFTSKIALETGINYFKRNFSFMNVDDSLDITDNTEFGVVSYEIPLQALFYIRLSQKFYMNVSMGTSFNWFASDVYSKGNDPDFSQYTEITKGWLKMALLANIGWEMRTEKSGYFYLGSSLHRPLFPIGTSYVKYDQGPWKYEVELPLRGGVLTFDFRYFFPESKRKKNRLVE